MECDSDGAGLAATGEFYGKVRELLKDEGLFATWFSGTRLEFGAGRAPVLMVPHDFSKSWITRKYSRDLNQIAEELWQQKILVEYAPPPAALPRPLPPQALAAHPAPPTATSAGSAKPRPAQREFTFESFIAGEENQLALVAARTLHENEPYSPFVLFGGHGLGKTHLAQALAAHWNRNETISWHAEEFANHFITASKENRLDAFRASLRHRKLLVVEDLDFFLQDGRRPKTLSELLHTFKVLKRDGRHIVVTSCRPVSDYLDLDRQLGGFLLSGLKVQLRPPAAVSRRAMVEVFAALNGVKLSRGVTEFTASLEFPSAGELKGAVQQLSAYAILEKDDLPLAVAREILSDHLRAHRSRDGARAGEPDLHSIAEAVGRCFGVGIGKLVARSRERHLCTARHTAMALSHECGHFTLQEIGRFYGGRQHQSVLFALHKVREAVKVNQSFSEVYHRLEKQIKGEL